MCEERNFQHCPLPATTDADTACQKRSLHIGAQRERLSTFTKKDRGASLLVPGHVEYKGTDSVANEIAE